LFVAAQAASVPYEVENDCHYCAERRMIKALKLEAQREGIHRACFSAWVHRKYGDLVIQRVLHDGTLGTSFPCVVCRKVLDKNLIQWKAHIGSRWIKSTDEDLPKSRPTQKQKYKLGFN
jgi:hypothetical protein